MNYEQAGVSTKRGDFFVESLKAKVSQTFKGHEKKIHSAVGGFCSLYESSPGEYLACGSDGVGTKLLVAKELGKWNTIGIDLVAMCANDILCSGAKPLFFQDYLATGKIDQQKLSSIMEGIIQGCSQAGLALIGGETAEMPDMYCSDDIDLAGFALGQVSKQNLIDGSQIQVGDAIIGLPSSGFHSNGYSLLRKAVPKDPELWDFLLNPTKIYWPEIQRLQTAGVKIKGMAHITGGGWENIKRINPGFTYEIDNRPSVRECWRDDRGEEIIRLLKLSQDELYSTFNMGIGFVLIIEKPDNVENGFCLGEVRS